MCASYCPILLHNSVWYQEVKSVSDSRTTSEYFLQFFSHVLQLIQEFGQDISFCRKILRSSCFHKIVPDTDFSMFSVLCTKTGFFVSKIRVSVVLSDLSTLQNIIQRQTKEWTKGISPRGECEYFLFILTTYLHGCSQIPDADMMNFF